MFIFYLFTSVIAYCSCEDGQHMERSTFGNKKCYDCGVGMSGNGCSCFECGSGTYQPYAKSEYCFTCEAGKYQPNSFASSCSPSFGG